MAATPTTTAQALRVLVCVASGRSGPGLVSLAGALRGGNGAPGEIEALHLLRPTDRASFILEQEQENDDTEAGLHPLLDRAESLGLAVRPTTFVSAEPAEDISRVAEVKRADLVLMGWHRPVVSQTLLGGIVYEVMKNAFSAVGVFVDRGMAAPRRVLVLFRGSPHDLAALSLAHRLMLHASAEVTVMAVSENEAEHTGLELALGQAVDRVFRTRDEVRVKTSIDSSAVAAVLAESARGYDLVVVGVGKVWGLEQRLIGMHPERLMQDSPVSLLVVRGSDSLVDAQSGKIETTAGVA